MGRGSEIGEGSVVEVSNEADGAPGGVWHVARVLEKTHVSENETIFLVDYLKKKKKVSSKFIRPLPPTPPPPPPGIVGKDPTFQVEDVVDVCLGNSWWTGKVFQQVEVPTTAYSVLLDNGHDLVHLRPSHLRHHIDWVHDDQTWLTPSNQMKQRKGIGSSNQNKEIGKKCNEIYYVADKMLVDDDSTSDDADDAELATRQSTGTSSTGEDELVEDLNLKLRDSVTMSFIEAMEVFESLPQKPHFSPLVKCIEVEREGLAVGHMMTFANTVRKISELELTAPSSEFDDLFDCLSKLECYGFNVERVQNRLLELKSMKEKRERLKLESRKIGSGIKERTEERTKIQAELDSVSDDLKVLHEKKRLAQEKILRLLSTSVEEEMEVAKLESSVDLLKEETEKGRHLFRNVAAAPWRR